MTKKKDSIFTEPYHLVKLIFEAAMLVVATLRNAIVGATNAAKDEAVTSEEAIAGYAKLQVELKTEEAAQSWKRFLMTGMAIQAFLLVLTLLHGVLGNYLILFELVVLTTSSIILFGYKPWIVRNKAVVPFLEYVKRIPGDPGCLVLWNSLKLLD